MVCLPQTTRDRPDAATARRWIEALPDPEIPVLTLGDLGVIRDVAWEDGRLVVTVAPTYSGCPATAFINLEIANALRARGIAEPVLKTSLSPAWTSDWIGAEGRRKLEQYGIAPPLRGRDGREVSPACPRCGSAATRQLSRFGSTPCKASWVCGSCLEPFELFKCH
jgi:ring-1,2-phenylacetyl-CoA epoxidase subunit PaaD